MINVTQGYSELGKGTMTRVYCVDHLLQTGGLAVLQVPDTPPLVLQGVFGAAIPVQKPRGPHTLHSGHGLLKHCWAVTKHNQCMYARKEISKC